MQHAAERKHIGRHASFGDGLIHADAPDGLFERTSIANGIVDRCGHEAECRIDSTGNVAGTGRVGKRNLESFGAFQKRIVNGRKIQTKVSHRSASSHHGQRSSRRIEAQITTSRNRCLNGVDKVGVVRRVRIEIGNRKLNAGLFSDLNRAVESNFVRSKSTFIDGSGSRDRPKQRIVVNNRSRHKTRTTDGSR